MTSGTMLAAQAGINEETFQAFLKSRDNEPRWLTEFRQRAWEAYNRLPMPTRRDEEWRRVDLRPVPMDAVNLPAGGARISYDAQALIDRGPLAAGLLVDIDGVCVQSHLDEELAAKGVIFCPFDRAAREHEKILRTHLGAQVPPEKGKFEALHYAFMTGGTFIYVPKGVQFEMPLRSVFWAESHGMALFAHTVIVLDEGAAAVIFDDRAGSPRRGSRSIVAVGVEASLAKGAAIQLASMQDFGRDTFYFNSEKVAGGEESNVVWLTGDTGARLSKGRLDCDLTGPRSEAKMSGVYMINGRQQHDLVTLLTHKAAHTEGAVLFKGVCDDAARSGFRGQILVEKAAMQTSSHLTDNTILLTDQARCDSVPTLEIKANDVVCKHAATVGEVSQEELFYLMSRGIARDEARRMIILGFFEQVLSAIRHVVIHERLRRELHAKFAQKDGE